LPGDPASSVIERVPRLRPVHGGRAAATFDVDAGRRAGRIHTPCPPGATTFLAEKDHPDRLVGWRGNIAPRARPTSSRRKPRREAGSRLRALGSCVTGQREFLAEDGMSPTDKEAGRQMTPTGSTPTSSASHTAAQGQSRRDEIVRLASLLFRDMGYHSATMDKIAEVAGIAKPTLYHYFRSKEEILFNIHLQYIMPLIESQRARVEKGVSSTRVVYEVILEHLQVIADSPGTLQ